jgi:hypothetical protein
MNRGDIYMVSLDPTQGHKQRGRIQQRNQVAGDSSDH